MLPLCLPHDLERLRLGLTAVAVLKLFEVGDTVRSKSPAAYAFDVEGVKWCHDANAQAILGPSAPGLSRSSVWYDAQRFDLVRKRKVR